MKRLALAALLVMALPLAAAEPWVDAYNRGVAAVTASNWKLAASELQKAIAETPTEGVGLRTRTTIITYVPHFWLGIAKYNLGDVDGALREFETSEKQGAIGRTEYYATMKSWVSRAEAEKRKIARNAASGGKKAAADAIAAAALAQSDALSANADRSESYRNAVRLLQEANAKYSRGGTDIAAYSEAAQIASRASTLFTLAAEEAWKQRAARPPATPKKKQEKVTEAVVLFPDAETATTAPSKPAPAKPEPPKPAVVEPPKPAVVETTPAPAVTEAKQNASAAVQQYRRNLGDANRDARGNTELQRYVRRATVDADRLRKRLDGAKNDADFQSISRMVSDLEQALSKRVAESKPAVVEPPAEAVKAPDALRDAYRAFANGDFASAEALLTKMLDERPSAEAFLLRGCARYTRAMLSRTPDAQRSGAVEDFRAALQQNRALRLDSRAFSPKLIAFFEDVRRSL